MKNKIWILASLILVVNFFACGNGAEEHHEDGDHAGHESMDGHMDLSAEGHSMQAQYKSVDAGSLKASFDFSTMADHMKAMQKMNMSMPMNMDQSKMGDHHVMLTLLNKSDNKMNMEVKDMSFTITGPDGKSVTKKAHVMHAKNMHHFGTDFQASGSGTYKIKATFKHAGKSHTPAVSFTMK